MDSQTKCILGITIFVLGLSLFLKVEEHLSDLTYVTASNGKEYRVRKLPDQQEAADRLANVHAQLFRACDILKQNHPQDPRVQRLLDRFSTTDLAEADGSEKNTSYSINKGEKIVLCLRQKDGTNRLVDANLILFVALHEISHIMTTSVGHTEEFWNNFRFVLKNCQDANLYKCINFSQKPEEYCGITVTNSPLPCV
jgi:hypothetical protein